MTAQKNFSHIVIFTLLACIGCTENTTEKPATAQKVTIKITPEKLDFGKVPPSNVPVDLSFEIENTGTEPFTVADISSGCGCTVVDAPQDPILPGTKKAVAVKVNIDGRRGAFTNQVVIVTEPKQVFSLDIVGEIAPPFWFDGQAIRCTAGTNSKAAKTTFNIYTSDYPEMPFEFPNLCKDISIKETSRTTEGSETTIKFVIEVNVKENTASLHQIQLKPVTLETGSLVIPLHVYRQEKENTLPSLATTQVTLGTIIGNSHEFAVKGDPDVIQVVDTVSLIGLPEVFSVEKAETNTGDKDSISLRLKIRDANFAGPFEGKLVLKTLGGREYSIPILGDVGPDPETNSETAANP